MLWSCSRPNGSTLWRTLIELRDNPETPASVRAMICKDLLDRVLGKAVQRIEAVNEVHSDDPVKEVEMLEAISNG